MNLNTTRSLFLCGLFLVFSSLLNAQRTSTDCHEELRYVCSDMSIAPYMILDSITKIDFTVWYQPTEPDGAKPVKNRKQLYIRRGQVRMISNDVEVYSDPKQSFWYYRDRDLIYHTKSHMMETEFVRQFDASVFNFGIVTQCELEWYDDSTASKLATFLVDASAMDQFGVTAVEVKYSPFDSTFSRLKIYYTPGSEWEWAIFDVHEFSMGYKSDQPWGSLESLFFSGNGLAPQWEGAMYLDRR